MAHHLQLWVARFLDLAGSKAGGSWRQLAEAGSPSGMALQLNCGDKTYQQPPVPGHNIHPNHCIIGGTCCFNSVLLPAYCCSPLQCYLTVFSLLQPNNCQTHLSKQILGRKKIDGKYKIQDWNSRGSSNKHIRSRSHIVKKENTCLQGAPAIVHRLCEKNYKLKIETSQANYK